MCGIAGAVDRRGGLTRDSLLAMAATLSHRGPNAQDAYVSADGIGGLSHRRLSIIDLSGGRQPMCNEDGTVWIAFNGEIYNIRTCAGALQDKGHLF